MKFTVLISNHTVLSGVVLLFYIITFKFFMWLLATSQQLPYKVFKGLGSVLFAALP